MNTFIKVFTVLFILLPSSQSLAQVDVRPYREDPYDREIMAQIVLQNLTVWTRPDGTPVYHQFCRTLAHGCEQQISTYVDYIFQVSYNQDVNPWFLAAVAWHESRFNPFAESSQGAIGLFQLLARGVWSRGLPFVRNRHYRQQCRSELGSCQYRSIRRAVFWLTYAEEYCGTVRDGLRMYNSGRCDGPRRYPRIVFSIYNNFLERAQELRQQHIATHSLDEENALCVNNG